MKPTSPRNSLSGVLSRKEHEAAEQLLREHARELEQFLKFRMDSRARRAVEIQEVLDTTYLEAIKGYSSFLRQRRGSFLAWCKKIADRNLLDALRVHNRQTRGLVWLNAIPSRGSSSNAAMLSGYTTTTASRQTAKAERGSHLLAAIERLPSQYRQPIQLCDIEGKNPKEAARALKCSVGAIWMRRQRGYDWLRIELGPRSRYFSKSDS